MPDNANAEYPSETNGSHRTVAATERCSIGAYADVTFDVVAADAAGADVDISFACMFEHEVGRSSPTGGLADLDAAMGGGLLALRSSRIFRGEALETLHLTVLPHLVRARAVMLIGLGEPDVFSAAVLERAARVALREAVRLDAASAAFAPGMLDSGVSDKVVAAAPAMLGGVLGAIDGEDELVRRGLTTRGRLRRWIFDSGATHLDAVAASFSEALRVLSAADRRGNVAQHHDHLPGTTTPE